MGLRISVDEGHALEVLDLLSRGRAVRIDPAEAVTRPRPELVEVAARRLGAVALRFLVDGGRRERTILRGGRRFRGRIWDRQRCGDFRLRFTAATYALWTELTPRFAGLARDARVDASGGASRWARRQIRRVVKVADTDTGDWLLYALAAENLRRSAMPAEIADDLRRRLALGSPLALLVVLIAPFVELFTRLTSARGLWARAPAEIVHELGALREFSGLVQRDALRRAYAELVDLGPRLFELRDRLAREAYGDPRYEEAQIVLEAVEPLRPQLPRLRALAGALANRLG